MEDFHNANLSFYPDLSMINNDTLFDNFTMFFNRADGSVKPNSPMLPYKYELDLPTQIGLYSAIFLLAVIGNSLVILTLVSAIFVSIYLVYFYMQKRVKSLKLKSLHRSG